MKNSEIAQIKTYYKKLFILANRLVKTSGKTRKECFAIAKDFLALNESDTFILVAEDTRGNLSTRLVFTNWGAYNVVKGTGRALKPGQRLFVDIAKRLADKPATVSFYQPKIKSLVNLLLAA